MSATCSLTTVYGDKQAQVPATHIENRYVPHWATPCTTVVPRSLASLCLRTRQLPDHLRRPP